MNHMQPVPLVARGRWLCTDRPPATLAASKRCSRLRAVQATFVAHCHRPSECSICSPMGICTLSIRASGYLPSSCLHNGGNHVLHTPCAPPIDLFLIAELVGPHCKHSQYVPTVVPIVHHHTDPAHQPASCDQRCAATYCRRPQ